MCVFCTGSRTWEQYLARAVTTGQGDDGWLSFSPLSLSVVCRFYNEYGLLL
jgi:hypothetical protein